MILISDFETGRNRSFKTAPLRLRKKKSSQSPLSEPINGSNLRYSFCIRLILQTAIFLFLLLSKPNPYCLANLLLEKRDWNAIWYGKIIQIRYLSGSKIWYSSLNLFSLSFLQLYIVFKKDWELFASNLLSPCWLEKLLRTRCTKYSRCFKHIGIWGFTSILLL